MVGNLHQLRDGSRIAVVGGGPAGAFFALYLLHYAREHNIHPEITIYERRNFNDLGPKGCKGCAGILSLSLSRNLDELGLTPPENIIQSRITQYAVHSPYTSISISSPEKGIRIDSIYRGGGPRISHYESRISFNNWLLGEALRRGVRLEEKTVSAVHLEKGAGIEAAGIRMEYDLVVLASGVNDKPIAVTGQGYIPPGLQFMAQAELHAASGRDENALGSVAHVFLIPRSGIIFGALVPKGPFINVSILGRGKEPLSVHNFLNLDLVRSVLPEKYEFACNCRPRVLTGIAGSYYADRFVAIGDAAVARLYKDGIGSSSMTAREAARTVVNYGISRRDFQKYYYPLCRSLDRGNFWGNLLFSLNDKVKNSRTFILAQNRLIGDEQRNIRGSRSFTRAAWGMFSGSYSYGSIAWMTLNPVSLIRLAKASLIEIVKAPFRKELNARRRLFVGSKKILILGSGFGGTYVFRHLIPSLNRNENVEITMVSNENYFLFSPLLHEVAMGKVETRHIAFPIRRLHWKDRFNFVQDTVEKIDLKERRVFTTSGMYEYDYLVLALGSITDTSELKSLSGNTFTLKTLHDSILIRNHIIGVFERAAAETDPEKQKQLLTFVVCGAGYTGVQVVTELRDFIYRHLLKFYRTIERDKVKIILVEAEPQVLAGLPEKLRAYALRQLQQMNIELRLNSLVTDVRGLSVEVNHSEKIDTHTLLWMAGIAANPRVGELDVRKDSLGRISVNRYLAVPEAPEVYAVGDCAHFEDPETGQPIPPRAHTSVRQARVVAHNILAELRGWDKRPYQYSHNAEMVSLGSSKAVFRFHNLLVRGLLARLIWIVGYAFLITGTYNRIRVLTDWGLSLLFGRDTTFLKLSR